VVVAAGFVMLSRMQSQLEFFVAIVVLAVGMSATGGATAAVVISHWFRRNRGRALGLMTLGGGTGGLAAPAFAWLIAEFGWRDALLITGLSQLIVCLPLAHSIRNRPEDLGLQVDGEFVADGEVLRVADMPVAGGANLSAGEALRSVLFWKLALVFALSNFATAAIIVHQVPFLTENVGMSDGAAAASMTVMTAISSVGRLGFGSAADRYA
jgi:sugar phosphate permease